MLEYLHKKIVKDDRDQLGNAEVLQAKYKINKGAYINYTVEEEKNTCSIAVLPCSNK